MSIDDADITRLNLIDQLVQLKTGQSLTNLQRLILSECWQTSRKTYEEIATQNNYSGSYIQQRVAPPLWHLLSEIVGTKVTKSNCRSVLYRYLETIESSAPLTVSTQLSDVSPTKAEADGRDQSTPPGSSSTAETQVKEAPTTEKLLLEFPTESVPLNSPFYIERTPHELNCFQQIMRPGALIRIKAPRQMGKTSLMNRIIAHAHAYPAVVLNFQQTEQTILSDLDRLLRWLCANITRQLKLSSALDDHWDEDIGSKMSCTLYMEEYLLEEMNTPIILALEESSELFEHLNVSKEFFSMLRTWHEYTKHQDAWKKLRLILVQSTESYIPLNINQSPFNVGFEVALTPFTPQQVNTLAECSHLTLNNPTCEQLMALLSGHPYLIRLALYHLAKGTTTCQQLFVNASTDEGIFSDHLHRHLWNLQQHAELCVAFRQVLNQTEPTKIAQKQAFKLQSMGLVTLDQNQVQVSCDLYRQYFSEHL
ncbi:MAG: AAA-like domain-containing protein [Cyanobacteria bacterium P01_A01_bin.116]